MNTNIDYEKMVDVIDKGILALNSYKRTNTFNIDLKNNISDVLNFFSLAKKPEYQELLFDKHISINKIDLEKIHSSIDEIIFSEESIQNVKLLLDKVGTNEILSLPEINLLQEYLLKVSQPIWISLNYKSQNGK